MSYEFECTNVVPGCEGKVTADTKDEVLEMAAAHADAAHGLAPLDAATVEKVKAAIVETN